MKTKRIPLCELRGCIIPKNPLYIGSEINKNFLEGLRHWGNGKLNEKGMKLYKSIEQKGYVPNQYEGKSRHITVNKSNVIMDGHHRAAVCAMLYGPLYQIKVQVKNYNTFFLWIIMLASIPFLLLDLLIQIVRKIVRR